MRDVWPKLFQKINEKIQAGQGGTLDEWLLNADVLTRLSGDPVAIDCLQRLKDLKNHAIGDHHIRHGAAYPFGLKVNKNSRHSNPLGANAVDISPSEDFKKITNRKDGNVDTLARSFRIKRTALPGDPPHFESTDSPCPTGCTIPDTLVASVASPVTMIITDPLGRRIGFDPSTGGPINEIGANAHYTGVGEPQVVTIDELEPGAYTLAATATGNGPYTLELSVINDEGEDVSTTKKTGTAALGVDIAPISTTVSLGILIDVKPNEYPNSINPKSTGNIPVAIISSSDFTAPTLVNPASLSFGRTGDEKTGVSCHSEDVDRDGLPDLVSLFNTQGTGFQNDDELGILKGTTVHGTPTIGTDSVNIVQ